MLQSAFYQLNQYLPIAIRYLGLIQNHSDYAIQACVAPEAMLLGIAIINLRFLFFLDISRSIQNFLHGYQILFS